MLPRGSILAAGAGVLALTALGATGCSDHPRKAAVAGRSDPTTELASRLAAAMARPWTRLQQRSGRFAAGGPSPYGDAVIGYALLEQGLRARDRALADSGLRALDYASARVSQRGADSVFANLALASAYNLARRNLGRDPAFTQRRAGWERSLEQIRLIRLPATTHYGNHWLVEAVAVQELLRSGLRSSDRLAVLGGARAEAARLSRDLINRRIPAMARAQGVTVGGRRLFVLSDPPDNPLAYAGLSLGFYARAIRLLGPQATPAARRTLLAQADAALWLTAPDGDAGYLGRNQEEAWGLTGTVYGAAAAGALREAGAARAADYRALAARCLERLRTAYGTGRYGVNITPAVGQDSQLGRRGLDPGAGVAQFSGLALVLAEWSVPELGAGRPALGRLRSDVDGGAVLGRGDGQLAVVRRGPLWFAVRASTSGRRPWDLRDDFGLLAAKMKTGSRWSNLIPLRPYRNAGADSGGPTLLAGAARGFPFGVRESVSREGTVTVRGGFRTAATPFSRVVANLPAGGQVRALDFKPGATLRTGVEFRFVPTSCGVNLTFPARAGDVFDYSLFLRPGSQTGAAKLRSRFSVPASVSLEQGYASGFDPSIVRARARLRAGASGSIRVTTCDRPGGAGG